MQTELAKRLGIEFPIFAFTHCRDVVVAVSKAGGFGVLGAVGFTPEQLETELTWIDEHIGDLPYGVDIVIPGKYEGMGEGDAEKLEQELKDLIPEQHRTFVEEILDDHGVPDIPDEDKMQELLGWTEATAGPQVQVALSHPKVKLLANALGTPPPDVIDEIHESGRLVAALCGTASQATRHANAGVDIVIAQGTEGGGHTGDVPTSLLLPQVVAAVGGVGIEVFLGKAHLVQVFAGRAVHHDGVGRRQVVGGDVVAEHCQRTHAAQRAFAGQGAFPVRRATDVGALRSPVVQRADRRTALDAHVEHRPVDLAELFRLDAGLYHRVDLRIAGPDVLQRHRLAVVVQAEAAPESMQTCETGSVSHQFLPHRGGGLLRALRFVAATQRQHRMRLRPCIKLLGRHEDLGRRQDRPLRVVLQEAVALAGIGPEVRQRFVDERVLPRIKPGTAALLRRHRQQGDLLMLSTATNRFITEPTASALGFEHLIGTDCDTDDQGRFTGRTRGTPNMRAGKIENLSAWLAARGQTIGGLTVSFYSDSMNDLPLLEAAQQPVAVDPEPALRALATARGWPIVSLLS